MRIISVTSLILFSILCFVAQASAQTTIEELRAHPEYTASGYLPYPEPDKSVKLTKAPAGYKPFYISHYGRHGSRYHHNADDYKYLFETLSKADSAGKLTQQGKYLLIAAQILEQKATPRAGDMTKVGTMQQEGIAKRMAKNFPDLFKSHKVNGQKVMPHVDAYASTSGRCIVSMSAFAAGLSREAPEVDFRFDSGKSLMDFICRFDWNDMEYTKVKSYTDESDKIWAGVNTQALMQKIFNDSAYAANIDASGFYNKLFEISKSMLGVDKPLKDMIHANLCDITTNKCNDILDSIFTIEESIARWQAQNAWWYSVIGTSPLQQTTKGIDYAKTTLENILNEADRAIAGDKALNEKKNAKGKAQEVKQETVATLRFGHDITLLTLSGLMQLSVANARVSDLSKLHEQWTDFRIIPMAANLQMVFYKKAAKAGQEEPILVKFLYNEREVTVPVMCEDNAETGGDKTARKAANKCPAAPYYRWDDVRNFYGKILAQ